MSTVPIENPPPDGETDTGIVFVSTVPSSGTPLKERRPRSRSHLRLRRADAGEGIDEDDDEGTTEEEEEDDGEQGPEEGPAAAKGGSRRRRTARDAEGEENRDSPRAGGSLDKGKCM